MLPMATCHRVAASSADYSAEWQAGARQSALLVRITKAGRRAVTTQARDRLDMGSKGVCRAIEKAGPGRRAALYAGPTSPCAPPATAGTEARILQLILGPKYYKRSDHKRSFPLVWQGDLCYARADLGRFLARDQIKQAQNH